jgi:hypothetical protein
MPRDQFLYIRMSTQEMHDLDTIVAFQRGTRSELTRAAVRSMILSVTTNFLGLPPWVRDQHPDMQVLTDRHSFGYTGSLEVPSDTIELRPRQTTLSSSEADESPLARPDTTPRDETPPGAIPRGITWPRFHDLEPPPSI